MSYTVLARKYRSQGFDDVVGQEPIAQTLKNAIKTGRVAHAYLFTGTRGVGKTTMARILAKALNCLASNEPTAEPCCKCDSCTAVNIGEDIDVIEIDGASNNGVEEVRRLRENAVYRPARARYKIYIIDEVHMLSSSAFNALLKILEEPPSHIKFIFATTEPNKVIATVQSRCQRFDFANISAAKIAGHLKAVLEKEKIKYEDNLIAPLAKMANGSMRDGLSLLDRLISTGVEPLSAKLLEEFLGCPNSEKVHNLAEKIASSDAAATLAAANDLINSGLNEVQIADSLIDYMRDLMVIKAAGTETELLTLTDQQRQSAEELAKKFDTAALVYNITTLEKLRWSLKNSETARPLLEAALLRFALSEHFLNVDELLRRLNDKSATRTAEKPAEPVKKNYPPINSPVTQPVFSSTASEQADLPLITDIESIKNNWQNILKAIVPKLGNSTTGLLHSALPTQLENNLLTLTFGQAAAKKICESNGRAEQIQAVLAEYCRLPLKLKFEIDADQQTQTESPKQSKTGGVRENEIINDPAIKTIIMELGATITGVEEN
jgi:DNA polymerase-3 subunit gamma/tau